MTTHLKDPGQVKYTESFTIPLSLATMVAKKNPHAPNRGTSPLYHKILRAIELMDLTKLKGPLHHWYSLHPGLTSLEKTCIYMAINIQIDELQKM